MQVETKGKTHIIFKKHNIMTIEERLEDIKQQVSVAINKLDELESKIDGNNNTLDLKSAAKYLNISTPTLRKYVKAGKIETMNIPGSSRKLFTKRAINQFLTQK